MEPMYHQYDVDAQTVIGFLRHHELDKDFKINVEANHATLAGHSFAHELQMCTDAGLLGSIDANRGNAQNGWDTDQFPTDLNDAVQAMMVVLADGGFKSGGLNFDAKVRRESTTVDDLVMAHIGGMDTFARALIIADNILSNSSIPSNKIQRYKSFDSGMGASFEKGELTLQQLRDYAAEAGETDQISGNQEHLENIINDYMFRS
jgi:xylose isomerase